MKKERKIVTLLQLFITFMKIGLFTFGGGYAMIPLIQKETVDKKKWIKECEIIDIISISESTPGPISVNAATYIGYKVFGFWGSLFATLGLIVPSFVIILIISYFYDWLLNQQVFQWIFKGLQAGVIILLFRAFINLKKQVQLNTFTTIVFIITLLSMIITTLFDLRIKIGNFTLSISLILIIFGLVLGMVSTAITSKRKKK